MQDPAADQSENGNAQTMPDADEKEIIVESRGLRHAYPGSDDVLKGIDLVIRKGEYTIITGANGSGKSTFALHLNGLLKPSAGTLRINGTDATVRRNIPAIRRTVGIVFQNPYMQFVGNTVEEDIAFGPENLALPRAEIKKRIDEALELVGMTAFRDSDPSSLSGGEAQRAAIAGVLAMDPEVIVFDEVASMLDNASVRKLREIIRRLREKGKTVIFISHNPADFADADKIVIFDGGRISFTGTPAEYAGSGGKLPDIGELMRLLKERGYPTDARITTPQEAVKLLLPLMRPPGGEY